MIYLTRSIPVRLIVLTEITLSQNWPFYKIATPKNFTKFIGKKLRCCIFFSVDFSLDQQLTWKINSIASLFHQFFRTFTGQVFYKTPGDFLIAIGMLGLVFHLVTHSFPIHPFSTSWKHECFQEVEKGCIGKEWVNVNVYIQEI